MSSSREETALLVHLYTADLGGVYGDLDGVGKAVGRWRRTENRKQGRNLPYRT
jgi:hypothetical protein